MTEKFRCCTRGSNFFLCSYKGGHLIVISNVITPLIGVVNPVEHLWGRLIGVITPFWTGRAHLVRMQWKLMTSDTRPWYCPPCFNVDFSKNRGTPKSSILIGFFIIFTIHFGGFPPIFGNTLSVLFLKVLSIQHCLTREATGIYERVLYNQLTALNCFGGKLSSILPAFISSWSSLQLDFSSQNMRIL